MNVLIVGSGGREHALAWKLAQSPRISKIFCAPGNAGTSAIGENVAIAADDIPALVAFANSRDIGLTVVGPDDSLAAGIADAFEAVVGAIYLDGGFEASRIFLLRQMEEVFADLASQPEEINPKGILQEKLQSITPNAPEYELLSQTGPEHSKRFVCRVMWNGQELGRGEGLSKKEAQVAAAVSALEQRPWEKRRKATTA